jgi:hypothetical protein
MTASEESHWLLLALLAARGGEQDDDDDDDEDEVVGTPCDSNSNLVIFAFVDGASPSSSRSMSAVDSSSALRLDILNPPL